MSTASSTLLRTVASAALLFGAGCTTIGYSVASSHIQGANMDRDELPETAPHDWEGNQMTARSHEVQLLDGTGNVCASLLTTMDAAASREGRIKKAQREGQSGTLTYEYNQVQAGMFGGYPCGIYVRWTDNSQATGFGWTNVDRPWHGEAGIMLTGWDPVDFLPGLYTGGGTRPSVGFYSQAHESYGSENVFLRLPIHMGLRFAPEWAFGVYAQALAGADLVTALFAYKEFSRTWHAPLDYQAAVGINVSVLNFGVLTGQIGYAKNAYVANEYLITNGGLEGNLSLTIGWDQLFSGSSSSSSGGGRASLGNLPPPNGFAGVGPLGLLSPGVR